MSISAFAVGGVVIGGSLSAARVTSSNRAFDPGQLLGDRSIAFQPEHRAR
jgi:hypothetical protein